jgi:hypothetical protein
MKQAHYEMMGSASSLLIAIGPFDVISIRGFPSTCEAFAAALPGQLKQLECTCAFLPKVIFILFILTWAYFLQAYEFYSNHVGVSYPFSSYKHLFLPITYQTSSIGASFCISK